MLAPRGVEETMSAHPHRPAELGAGAARVPAGDLHRFTLSRLARWRRFTGRRGETRCERRTEADGVGSEWHRVGWRCYPLCAIGR